MPAQILIRIPSALRPYTNNLDQIQVQADTVGQAIAELEIRHPDLRGRLLDESGALRRFVNLYANEDDIRFLKNLQTPLHEGDELTIIPAIAGG